MADKDWVKKFPRAFRGFVSRIHEKDYQGARDMLRLEIKAFLDIGGSDLLEFLFQLGNEFESKDLQNSSIREIDTIFDLRLQESELSRKPTLRYLAKDAFLNAIKSKFQNPFLSETIISQFVENIIQKECLDRINFLSPEKAIDKNKLKNLRMEINSNETQKIVNQVVSDITKQFVFQEKNNEVSNPKISGRFNLLDSEQLRKVSNAI
ncbi:MAG: hypothetical protein GW938_00075 [Leptospira sp.]|nr:hypothetical protein [Leptospira sp.]NCS94361.1 hypothetical protein [Leptospira sp.]